jgi:DNA mismatch repair protein MutS2
MNLQEARHPVLTYLTRPELVPNPTADQLDFESVVPLDVHVGEDFGMLIITGPNTGGKTVALKTVGLLGLMTRAGMNVPAAQATIPFYDAIYADIGDEQSLEQSLSTFSSHMGRIIRVLRDATDQSLVLLDELGAGTDPAEGAALGEAVLAKLSQIGCSSVVVTHLGRLKTYAAAHPGVESASMEFDLGTLRPTYRLLMGTVGSSNALEIAERLGLGQDILERARQLLDTESGGEYSAVLDQVTLAREDAEQRRDRLRFLEQEAARLKGQYEEMLLRLKAEEERRGADVGLKFRRELEALRDQADSLHQELRHSYGGAAKRARAIRTGLDECLQRLSALLDGHSLERPLKPGDEVYVIKIHKWGTVKRAGRKGRRVQVLVGEREIEVDADELQPWGHDV